MTTQILKLNLTNIWRFPSNLVHCEPFLGSNYPVMLDLCKTNMDNSINSSNLSVRHYLPLIRNVFVINMHGLAVYVREELSFARDLSLENFADSCLCFRLALLHSVPYFLFLYWPPSSSLCTAISSNIDEFLSISPSANSCLWRLHHPS